MELVVGAAPHGGTVSATDVALLQGSLHAFALDSIPGAGHYLQEEQPAVVVEAVARLAAALSSQAVARKP